MASRHWLDPLARQLLVATGQIPASPSPAPAASQQAPPPSTCSGASREDEIERELLALKLRQDPSQPLRDADAVRHAAALGWRLDVNRATAADWWRLPGIGADQVDLLLRLQAGGIQLSDAEDLHKALGWSAAQVAPWLPVLAFRWYGEPPTSPERSRVDLNRASASTLLALGLSSQQSQRLQRERARRPFQDLAELQERLQLPPALVERWLGRVRFGAGPAGPVLPPGPRR
ncbi:helix-hairpin-helix domain-containing protein [Cyanobium sp. LEGE 06113]|uniref:helix-hairpin-helix domain-containing protein n=1 Tax=Cyanobium sp. LEGE 06113 TaxID=1297573 RepID=UPI001880EDB0|nr:helix-hairpin-helix domain-containing protein [Cyanobium sp. LEGE 06113]MBE9154178.1 helix-hairpin-helix domain-containing protein [Cyanobium sp. LEGE 06113]